MKTQSFIWVAGFAAFLQAAAAADITGTVTLTGTPPPERPITPLKDDPTCGKFYTEMPTTHFFVVGPNKELADVIVMLKGVSGKSTGASAPAVMLDQKGCLYGPQILAIQTNQKLLVRNSDPVLHNVHATPAASGNKEENQAQMPGSPDLTFTFPAAENFLRVKCDVHPWMFAWITVVDSPYFAVTGKDGTFKISNVPPGKYTLTALHRKAAPTGMDKDIEVKEGETAKVDFTLEIK
ncbi:MAG: carboxypeptidase regulatory-like domain-containing protein [Verrucomicrobiota bacterium]|jgi:plastocyanin